MRFAWLTAVAVLVLFLAGCASTPAPKVELPPPISMAEIKEMSAKGVSDETIISALRATRAAYYLKSEHVTDLQQSGVSAAVIDYLIASPQIFPPLSPPPPPVYYYPGPFWPDYYPSHFHFRHYHHGRRRH